MDYYKIGSGRAKQNVGNANVKGFEVIARYSIENLNLSASYSRTRTDYEDSIGVNLTNSTLAYSDSGDKYTFNAMRKSAMEADFSWKESAKKYLSMYKELL